MELANRAVRWTLKKGRRKYTTRTPALTWDRLYCLSWHNDGAAETFFKKHKFYLFLSETRPLLLYTIKSNRKLQSGSASCFWNLFFHCVQKKLLPPMSVQKKRHIPGRSSWTALNASQLLQLYPFKVLKDEVMRYYYRGQGDALRENNIISLSITSSWPTFFMGAATSSYIYKITNAYCKSTAAMLQGQGLNFVFFYFPEQVIVSACLHCQKPILLILTQ